MLKLTFLFTLFPLIIFCQTEKYLGDSAWVKLKSRDFKGAISYYNKIISLDSTISNAYDYRAFCNSQLKDYAEAIQDYTKCILLTNDSIYYYKRALLKMQINDYNGALEDLDKSFESGKDVSIIYYLKGNCKYRTNDFQGSLKDLDKSIEMRQDYMSAYFFRGLVKLKLNEQNDACINFRKAKELNSTEEVEEHIQKYYK